MEDREIRLEGKIDKILDRLGSIDTTLAVNTESLAEHMRRTEALEKVITPLERGYTMAVGIIKFFGFLAVLAGIIEGIMSLLSYLREIK